MLAARQPAVALATAVTVALLGLATASYSLYLASAGSGAVSLQEAERCPVGLDASVSGSGPVSGIGKAATSLTQRSTQDLSEAGAIPTDLGTSIVTVDQTGLGLRAATKTGTPLSSFQLASRTAGLANVTVVASAGGEGVWLPNDLAKSIGATAGSRVQIGADPGGSPIRPRGATDTIRVAGIYQSLVGTVLPRFWCSETSIFGSYDAAFPPPPVVLASQGTFLSVVGGLRIQQLTSFQWERDLAPDLNVDETTKAMNGLGSFDDAIGVQSTGIFAGQPGTALGGGISGSANLDNQLTFVVAHARAIETALRSGILPVTLAGVAVCALLVAAAGSYWADRRRVEVALLSSKGAGPAALGFKAALENLVPVVAGAVAGWGAAYGLVIGIGPSSEIPETTILDALLAAVVAGTVALVLVGLIAAVRVRTTDSARSTVRGRFAKVPFELVPLGISIWAWSSLGQQSLQAAGTSAPGVGPSFLAFPILFVLSVAALSARLTSMLLASGWFRRVTSPLGHPGWLASRRLAGAPRIAAVCVASVAAAVGVLIYGSALTTSQNSTLNAKASVFIGSTTSLQLASPAPVPASLASTTTAVLTSPNAEIGQTDVDVIGIDPRTFASGAFWDSSFSSQSLQSLLDELSQSPSDGAVPVIEAGGLTTGSLSLQSYGIFTKPIPVKVVADLKYFPGENGQNLLVVMSGTSLERYHLSTAEQLWSRDDDQVVLSDIDRAGDTAAILVTTGSVLDQTTFAAIAWTFSYLQALGVLAGAVIVGGLLLFVSTRARARALAYVLSRRMGLRRAGHFYSLLIEVGVMVVPGALVGGVVGWIAVELAEPHLNPLPLLAPRPLLELPYAAIAGASAAAVGIWALVSGWAQHVADSSRASELLRADD
jgi:putative ABC transport system permease protein